MPIRILYTKEVGSVFCRSIILHIDALYNNDIDLMYDEIYVVSIAKDLHVPIGGIQ